MGRAPVLISKLLRLWLLLGFAPGMLLGISSYEIVTKDLITYFPPLNFSLEQDF